MVLRLSLGFCCSLLWLGVGCGQTSNSPPDKAQAGTAGAGAQAHGGGGATTAAAGASAGSGADAPGGSAGAGAPAQACQTIAFEDARVEQAVRAKLGWGEQEPLDATRVSQLGGTLYLEAVTSLAGLECTTGLTGLDVTGGVLADVSAIAELPKLRNVTFRKTELGPQALGSLSTAPALRELFFHDIPIDDLSAIAKLPALTDLVVDHGQVSDVGPLASTKLASLLLDDSPLADLEPLATLTSLRTLSLARTKVTSIEALAQLSLQELNLDGSLVTSLAALGGPFLPKECSHLQAEQVPLADESWTTDRARLCGLGWAVRASRPADADPVTCGDWCDIQ